MLQIGEKWLWLYGVTVTSPTQHQGEHYLLSGLSKEDFI